MRLVDGVQDVLGLLGMVRCVWEWCSPLRECLLSKCQCSRGFGNAADEFRNAIDGLGRPGMVWVWSGTVQVGSGL